MIPPRYRTLDGDEVQLPLVMDSWVLVPLALARFDPELAWTLDYEDAPEPEDTDPRLDFSAGALLVPVERWNEHAAVEPNLAPCSSDPVEAPAPRRTVPAVILNDPWPAARQTAVDIAARARARARHPPFAPHARRTARRRRERRAANGSAGEARDSR